MSELKQLQRQLREITEEAHQMRLACCNTLAANLERHADVLRKRIREEQKHQRLGTEADTSDNPPKKVISGLSFWQRLRLVFTGKAYIRED
jgi:hypothetical protein